MKSQHKKKKKQSRSPLSKTERTVSISSSQIEHTSAKAITSSLSSESFSLTNFIRKNWQVLLYTALGIFLRTYNLHGFLYFIYDQGRDALVLQRIASGDPVLVGPTSGLSGFMLGPLWYYVGVPGYIFSDGSPYGIGLWYILLSCLALPAFWWLSHQLFSSKIWALLCASLLLVFPGSISGSTTIWNPLISLPLMIAALYSFWKARPEAQQNVGQKWLALGFLSIALTLQSEFAYAIFFILPLFLLIPWIRQQKDWKDFATAIFVTALTGIPQLLFELRHMFIMTRSLLGSLLDNSKSISWSQLLDQRPDQLWSTTMELFLGGGQHPLRLEQNIFGFIVIGMLATFLYSFKERHISPEQESQTTFFATKDQKFLWQLTALFACIPYPFYMIWRGNYGNFFNYYLTPHFIFLTPLLVLGMKTVFFTLDKYLPGKLMRVGAAAILTSFIVNMLVFSWNHWYNSISNPENNAGLRRMVPAVAKFYEWQKEDKDQGSTQKSVIRVFTPNIVTEHYDYLLGWYALENGLETPRTVLQPNDQIWYVLLEKREIESSDYFKKWYSEATQGGQKIREEQFGILTLEKWQKVAP